MTVRHLTPSENVDAEGFLIDPSRACHGALRNGRVEDLSGPVDPLTHLNRDFPDHELGECVIVERLECGGKLLTDSRGTPLRARPRRASSISRGNVDVGERRCTWLAVLRERRQEGRHVHR